MKRVSGHVLAGLTLLVGASAIPACVHNDSSMFIQSVLAQQLVTPGQECKYSADPTQTYITTGYLDVALRPQGYSAEFLVGNQLVPEVNPQTPTTETSIVRLEGAVVRITDASGAQIKSYTRSLGATVYPATGTTPGYASVSALIIDPGTAASVGGSATVSGGGAALLVTHTRFFGHTLGGKYVETDEFGFPVSVCAGCLLPVGCVNAPATTAATMMTSTEPIPCKIGQDIQLSCSTCFAVVSPATACVR
jgi:hypothetical protein